MADTHANVHTTSTEERTRTRALAHTSRPAHARASMAQQSNSLHLLEQRTHRRARTHAHKEERQKQTHTHAHVTHTWRAVGCPSLRPAITTKGCRVNHSGFGNHRGLEAHVVRQIKDNPDFRIGSLESFIASRNELRNRRLCYSNIWPRPESNRLNNLGFRGLTTCPTPTRPSGQGNLNLLRAKAKRKNPNTGRAPVVFACEAHQSIPGGEVRGDLADGAFVSYGPTRLQQVRDADVVEPLARCANGHHVPCHCSPKQPPKQATRYQMNVVAVLPISQEAPPRGDGCAVLASSRKCERNREQMVVVQEQVFKSYSGVPERSPALASLSSRRAPLNTRT
eukprot:1196350-Prorocentrum_minimum.AAC.1